MEFIRFENVRFCYENICAVDQVDFTAEENTITAIVGPNGGGKSTLIKLLVGFIRPDHGQILFAREHTTGYVSQSVAFRRSFPITVRQMVLMGTLDPHIKPFYKYTEDQKKIAEESLIQVGLETCIDRHISQLSIGQLQRACIARALASKADLLVLDEPDAGLDITVTNELYAILNSLKKDHTIVIASHHIDAILDIADKAVYANRSVQQYPLPEVLQKKLKGGIQL